MNTILIKILIKRFKPVSLIISGVGLLLGLTLIFLCIQIYMSLFRSFSEQVSKSDFLVVSKEINLLNTLFNADATIPEEEINDLKSQPFVQSLAYFTPNHFTVYAQLTGHTNLGSELFFESVPDEFIDNLPTDFKWNVGDAVLPIIVSEDFLNLYNYGYAMGSGLPQISKSTISMVQMQVILSGAGGKHIMKAKIVGFSERISSVLVPHNFMEWANKNIGAYSGAPKPSRLILKVNKKFAAQIEKYLSNKSLHINSEKLGASKLGAITKIALDILIVVAALFILFSVTILMMHFALIIAEAKPDLALLFQLGYHAKTITKHLFVFFFTFVTIVSFLSILLFVALWNYAAYELTQRAIEFDKNLRVELLGYISLVFLTILSFGLISLTLMLSREKK
ncbi:MAG: hypothetical protein NZ529_01970 [Cytophagaceae bacterium]|nr:hypothetical protein [Cytophagaceae bacterium]MDW8455535.1 hypothetical protein [Cytophagaceae bacterium]